MAQGSVDRLEVDWQNADRVLASQYAGVQSQFASQSYEPNLESFSKVVEKDHQKRFDERESPLGEKWPAWFWREVGGDDSHETLENEGTLRHSLLSGFLGHIENIDKTSLVWGTSVAHAAIHNFGAEITTAVPLVSRGGHFYKPAGSRLSIPQREFLGLTENMVDSFVGRLADSVAGGLKPRASQPTR